MGCDVGRLCIGGRQVAGGVITHCSSVFYALRCVTQIDGLQNHGRSNPHVL